MERSSPFTVHGRQLLSDFEGESELRDLRGQMRVSGSRNGNRELRTVNRER